MYSPAPILLKLGMQRSDRRDFSENPQEGRPEWSNALLWRSSARLLRSPETCQPDWHWRRLVKLVELLPHNTSTVPPRKSAQLVSVQLVRRIRHIATPVAWSVNARCEADALYRILMICWCCWCDAGEHALLPTSKGFPAGFASVRHSSVCPGAVLQPTPIQ